jgi:hypothetical protein
MEYPKEFFTSESIYILSQQLKGWYQLKSTSRFSKKIKEFEDHRRWYCGSFGIWMD